MSLGMGASAVAAHALSGDDVRYPYIAVGPA